MTVRIVPSIAKRRSRILAYAGRLCFGIYVLHYFVRVLAETVTNGVELGTASRFGVLAAYGVAVLLLATVSYHVFEMPVQQLRTRFEEPSRHGPAS